MSRDYPVVTEGHTIAINYTETNRVFYIDILETKPSPIIQIINTNINVDFDAPLDYNEPEPYTEEENTKEEEEEYCPRVIYTSAEDLKRFRKHSNGFVPFSGRGFKLGSK